jgi:ABC-type sugar transport system substrate-binding protein
MKKVTIIGGTLLAVLVAGVVAIAVWPASETDKARDNGEQVGQAVNHLYNAESSSGVDAALNELDAAVSDTRADVSNEFADQVDAQTDALNRAADGFAGSRTTDDAWEADLYQAELDTALDDLADNASDFRAQGPEVHQAFWDGFQSGVNS